VEDEESIIVPARRDQQVELSGLLNLNHASQAELEALPSIGPVTAKRILEYREARGEFVNLQQLLNLKLIHQGQFDAIRDLVTIE
jgi:competence protein ComEA